MISTAQQTAAPVLRESGVQLAWLHDGRRLHLQHGPIDLIIMAEGPPQAVQQAWRQAIERFDSMLQSLVDELPLLRRDVADGVELQGEIARAMQLAAGRVRAHGFASPMIAVAGSVADAIAASMQHNNPALARASVNNGGDIALYLSGDSLFDIGLADLTGKPMATIRIGATDAVRGVATSGWQGRSMSLGIADAVTVLASTAAAADAAATMVANAVNLADHPAIERAPACVVDPDTDLGEQPVTVAVAALGTADVEQAMQAGAARAEKLCASGDIIGACICLQGRHKLTGIGASARLPSHFNNPENLQYA